eukprot:3431249-Prymnesium_polylepis.1
MPPGAATGRSNSCACGSAPSRVSRTRGLRPQKASRAPIRSSHASTACNSIERLGAAASAAY